MNTIKQKMKSLAKLLLYTVLIILIVFIIPSKLVRNFSENGLIRQLLMTILPLIFFVFYSFKNRNTPLVFQSLIFFKKILIVLLFLTMLLSFNKYPYFPSFELNTFLEVTIICLAIGFIEEIIFRGILFRLFQKSKFPIYLLVSSILFGLLHLHKGISSASMALIAGFLFGLARISGISLVPLIICHAITDIPLIWIKYGNKSEVILKKTSNSEIIDLGIFIFISTLLSVIVIYLFNPKHWTNKLDEITTGNKV